MEGCHVSVVMVVGAQRQPIVVPVPTVVVLLVMVRVLITAVNAFPESKRCLGHFLAKGAWVILGNQQAA
jgi:hypothetical protein